MLQLLQRGKSREQRLQDALRNIQGNAALVEELLSWLTEAQVLLATKEKDPIPEDLNVVETLAKEHTVSINNKKNENLKIFYDNNYWRIFLVNARNVYSTH